eukprot:PhM_4_TR16639/c0_g1_i1/m.60049
MMSDTLESLLARERELAKAIKARKAVLAKEKAGGAGPTLATAAIKELSPAELEAVRDAFTRFDADKSGFISLQELQLLTKELGAALSDDDVKKAMSELDGNGDGNLSFDEFRAWWCASSSRGGYKGLKLNAIKAKVLADLAQRRLKKIAKAASEPNATPNNSGGLAPSSQSTILKGDKGGFVESRVKVTIGNHTGTKSGVSAVAMPCKYAELEQEFARHGISYGGEERPKEGPVAAATVRVSVRAGTSAEALQEAVETAQSIAEEVGTDDMKVLVEAAADGTALVLRIFKLHRKAKPSLESALRQLGGGSVDELSAKAISSASASLNFSHDLSAFFRVGECVNLLDPLEGTELRAHGKLFRSVLDFVDATKLKVHTASRIGCTSDTYRVHLAETADVNLSFSSAAEALDRLIRLLCRLPIRMASHYTTSKDDLECDVADVERECNDLYAVLNEIKKDVVHGTSPAQLLLPLVSDSLGEALDVAGPVVSVLESVQSVNIIAIGVRATVTFTNLPVFNVVSGDTTSEAFYSKCEEGAEVKAKLKKSVLAHTSTFDGMKALQALKHKVLDDDDDTDDDDE